MSPKVKSNKTYAKADENIGHIKNRPDAEIKEIRKRAAQVADQALWKHFIQYYYEAYDLALRNAM